MSTETLYRWGGLAVILTALLFAVGSVAVLLTPNAGLANAAPAIMYYTGLVIAVPALVTLYAVQAQHTGKLGFAGFVLAVIGAVMYSAPAFLVIAGAANVEGWHSVWAFAMTSAPILLIGPAAFLIGSFMLGLATMRAGVLPHRAGLLFAVGSILWLFAFVSSLGPLLTVANLVGGAGLGWMGLALWPSKDEPTPQPRLERAV